ncbi:MAG: hypothetical protein KDD47_14155 [Acidobacteria bacterium]|nr:hypothetical protein [Acidobacteriota bacterium]
MTKSLILAAAYVLTAALLSAVAQFLIQTGAKSHAGGWLTYFVSPWVLAGMGCHLVVLCLFTLAFRSGGTVPLLYPLYASTYIWAALLGAVLYRQPIRPLQVAGMALLILGMAFLSGGVWKS